MVPVDVEIKANRDLKGTNERGPSLPWLVCRAGTRDFCSALAALIDQTNVSPPYTISILLSPSPIQLGRQPFCVACL